MADHSPHPSLNDTLALDLERLEEYGRRRRALLEAEEVRRPPESPAAIDDKELGLLREEQERRAAVNRELQGWLAEAAQELASCREELEEARRVAEAERRRAEQSLGEAAARSEREITSLRSRLDKAEAQSKSIAASAGERKRGEGAELVVEAGRLKKEIDALNHQIRELQELKEVEKKKLDSAKLLLQRMPPFSAKRQ